MLIPYFQTWISVVVDERIHLNDHDIPLLKNNDLQTNEIVKTYISFENALKSLVGGMESGKFFSRFQVKLNFQVWLKK